MNAEIKGPFGIPASGWVQIALYALSAFVTGWALYTAIRSDMATLYERVAEHERRITNSEKDIRDLERNGRDYMLPPKPSRNRMPLDKST